MCGCQVIPMGQRMTKTVIIYCVIFFYWLGIFLPIKSKLLTSILVLGPWQYWSQRISMAARQLAFPEVAANSTFFVYFSMVNDNSICRVIHFFCKIKMSVIFLADCHVFSVRRLLLQCKWTDPSTDTLQLHIILFSDSTTNSQVGSAASPSITVTVLLPCSSLPGRSSHLKHGANLWDISWRDNREAAMYVTNLLAMI